MGRKKSNVKKDYTVKSRVYPSKGEQFKVICKGLGSNMSTMIENYIDEVCDKYSYIYDAWVDLNYTDPEEKEHYDDEEDDEIY